MSMGADYSASNRRNAAMTAIALALLLASCAGGTGTQTPAAISATATVSPTPAEPTVPLPALLTPVATLSQDSELRLWLPWEGQELEAFARVIELFAEEYPNITFRLTYVPAQQMLEALRTAPAGSGPTVFFALSSSAPSLWGSGLIQDVTDRITSELHSSLQSVAWNQAVYDGNVVGLPFSLNGVLLYRNRELVLSRAETVTDLVSAATELRGQGQGIGAALDIGFTFSASRLNACDGSIYAPDGSMGFTVSAGLCWLELERLLSQAGRVVFNSNADLDLFISGRSAWLVDVAANAPEILEALGEDHLAVDAWPTYEVTDKSLAGFVWTENAYFPANLTQSEMEAAWAFVSFMLTPQVQLMLADPQGAWHIPALARLDLEDGFQIQVLGALLNGVPLPLNPLLVQTASSLENAARLVAQQGADPVLALSVLITELSSVLPTPLPTPEN